jgi:drug/metabolite transporter (DMT)-like permease
VLGNALAWFLWLFALRSLPAGRAGIGTLAIPVIGVISAWVQLGERPGVSEGGGMILIIGALGLVTALEFVSSQRRAGGIRNPPDTHKNPIQQIHADGTSALWGNPPK